MGKKAGDCSSGREGKGEIGQKGKWAGEKISRKEMSRGNRKDGK